jgi:hypothetical protein
MHVHFSSDNFYVDLSDGRVIGVPLDWFPRLLHGTAEQREHVRISSRGLHWDALDEDVSIEALIEGKGDQTAPGKTPAPSGMTLFKGAWASDVICDERWRRDCWAPLSPWSVSDLEKWDQQCVTVEGRPTS